MFDVLRVAQRLFNAHHEQRNAAPFVCHVCLYCVVVRCRVFVCRSCVNVLMCLFVRVVLFVCMCLMLYVDCMI